MANNHFYIIGTGPSGPQMSTLQALNTIKKMDAIITTAELSNAFAQYIEDKPVLFDPWKGFWDYNGKHFLQLNKDEMASFRVERFRLRDERVKKIRELLAQGKNVALLDPGNQCLFGAGHWYIEQFEPEEIIIIPGMGCDTVALAALGKSIIPSYNAHFVMQTTAPYLSNWDLMLKDLSRYPFNVVFYMSLEYPEKLFARLQKVYPLDMPCAAVYWAGFPDKQRIIKGTITDMGEKLSTEKEKYMGLLFIGRFLEGKPYETAIKYQ